MTIQEVRRRLLEDLRRWEDEMVPAALEAARETGDVIDWEYYGEVRGFRDALRHACLMLAKVKS